MQGEKEKGSEKGIEISSKQKKTKILDVEYSFNTLGGSSCFLTNLVGKGHMSARQPSKTPKTR